MISRGNGNGRDKWWRDSDRLQAIARFMLLAMIGMFTGYTLVSLFGLIIGGVLSFSVVWYFQKVMNSAVGEGGGRAVSKGRFSPLISSPKAVRGIKLKYRCLSCSHVYTAARRECPKCGSRIKQVEF